MNIKHPGLIFMIILIPACAAFLCWVWRRRKKILAQFCDSGKLKNIFPFSSRERTIARYILLVIACAMFVMAFISPRWGYDWQEVETRGVNIFIVLDVSKSMLAEDVQPSRLARAKQEISDLIDKLNGDRVGLIVFAGEAFLQSPLTHDYMMVKDWISKIDVDSVTSQGTSVKSAIEQALKGFRHIKSESKILIVVSDGEEHDKETVDMAIRAKQEGIKIFTIGVGTAKGAPIPLDGALVRDEHGEVVISKFNDDLLKNIAENADGYYVRSTTGDFHLESLYYEHIKKQSKAELLKSGKSKLWYETYQIFISIALAALIIELLLSLNLGIADFFSRLSLRLRNKK
jgi:Ca-activated chloride channel family protein